MRMFSVRDIKHVGFYFVCLLKQGPNLLVCFLNLRLFTFMWYCFVHITWHLVHIISYITYTVTVLFHFKHTFSVTYLQFLAFWTKSRSLTGRSTGFGVKRCSFFRYFTLKLHSRDMGFIGTPTLANLGS